MLSPPLLHIMDSEIALLSLVWWGVLGRCPLKIHGANKQATIVVHLRADFDLALKFKTDSNIDGIR